MRHDLKTIQDIVDVVSEDNIDNFMVDFRGFLDGFIALQNIGKLVLDEDDVEIDHRVKVGSLIWIDDNENKVSFTLRVEDENK